MYIKDLESNCDMQENDNRVLQIISRRLSSLFVMTRMA